MEENIKRLNEIISLCKEELENSDENTFATMDIHDIQALSDLINDYKRIEDENIGFRARYLIELNRQEYLYIPKSKVREKIEELNNVNNAEALEDLMNTKNYTITQLVQYVLQELLREE